MLKAYKNLSLLKLKADNIKEDLSLEFIIGHF